MTTTLKDAPTTAAPAIEPKPLSQKLAPLAWAFAIVALLFVFGRSTLDDPTQTAATRDPAWYTWRSGLIVHSDDPGTIAEEWGPFSMFSGGYRVSVPVSGALLQDVAGANQITFPGFMMVGIPIFAGLAFAAAAWRSTRDTFLSVLTMFVTGVFFLTTPYVGYLDNLFVLFILGSLIAFLEPARYSWGARSAVFMLALLAMFTHPTTCAVFLGTMFAVVGWHLLTMGFKIRRVLDRDLPALLAVFSGMMLGAALWVGGELFLWGHPGNLVDAALPPPFPTAFFVERLGDWISSQWWYLTVPLMLVAICWVFVRSFREAKPADSYRTMSIWWLLPYAATALTYFMGKPLPYYRFMNATAAIMMLTALGIWVIARWIIKKADRSVGLKAAAWVGVIAVLAAVFIGAVEVGYETSEWNDPTNQWVDQETRAAIASVATVAASDQQRPIVFVNNYKIKFQAYGWAKTYNNASRSALPPGVGPRAFQYFGNLEDYLANRRSVDPAFADKCNPILEGKTAEDIDLSLVTGGPKKDEAGNVVLDENGDKVKNPPNPDCTYDLVSAGMFLEMQDGVAKHGGRPFVFMVKGFNGEAGNPSTNLKYWGADADQQEGFDALTELGPDVYLVTTPDSALPSEQVLQDARAAGQAEAASLAAQKQAGPFADPGHLLRVLLGLFVLVVLPGLLAARWFGLNEWQLKLGLVPVVSIAMNILWAIVVIAVTRSAFGPTNAWIAVGLSTASAGGLNVMDRKREKNGPGSLARRIHAVAVKLGDSIEDMGRPLRHASFKSLMGAQWASMFGDGIVAGTIIATALNLTKQSEASAVLMMVFGIYLPFALVAPFLGVLADRFDRPKMLLIANWGRVPLVAAAAVAMLLGIEQGILVSGLGVLMLAGFRITLMVKGAGTADAVGGEDLLTANSLSQFGGTVFQAAGAILATALTMFLPMGIAVLTAVAAYAIAGAFARGIQQLETQVVEGTVGSALRGAFGQVVSGIKEIRSRPGAGYGILSFWLVRSLMFGFIRLQIAFEVVQSIQLGSKAPNSQMDTLLNILFAGIGGAIGMFLSQKDRDRVAPASVVYHFTVTAGAVALLVPVGYIMGGALETLTGILAAFVAGLAFFMVKVSSDTITQRALPDDFRGRAYSFFDITYALSYALPAIVLFVVADAGLALEWAVGGYGAVVVVVGLLLGSGAKRKGLFTHVSDDLTEEELSTGTLN